MWCECGNILDLVELKHLNNSKGGKGCREIVCVNKQPRMQDYNSGLERIQIPHRNNQKEKRKKLSTLIFIEMSVDMLFHLQYQRVECRIFCRWDWAAVRGLVANTIEECKHT